MHKDGEIVLGQWRLPRADFANPKLRQYLIGALLHWARDVGMDGFRCDVSPGVPVEFWEEARTELDRVNPELVMLGESESPAEVLKAFDAVYAFSYQTALRQVFGAGAPAGKDRAQWKKNRSLFRKVLACCESAITTTRSAQSSTLDRAAQWLHLYSTSPWMGEDFDLASDGS